ncbi:MAG TPA: hypothetical protein VFE24_07845 [Pirellulales bacterium]|jgi:hypothetical protein|nr:hypothetical protein [Pirellulales bacterium]
MPQLSVLREQMNYEDDFENTEFTEVEAIVSDTRSFLRPADMVEQKLGLALRKKFQAASIARGNFSDQKTPMVVPRQPNKPR